MEENAEKIREILYSKNIIYEEKRMFGGICFMVNEKMCLVIKPTKLMVRIDPKDHNDIAEKEEISEMVHAGKVVFGFIYIDNDLLNQKKLQYWIDLALLYNIIAPKSIKKKK